MSERALFEAALKIKDPVKRKAYLDKICVGRPKLRASVEALLKAHEEAGSFLNVAAIEQLNKGGTKALDQTIAPSTTHASGPSKDDEEEMSLGYLSPSNKKGSLGRLGHYEVIKILGKGGFGTVLKAFDEKLHRMVAIKVMDPQMAATSPPRKRFLREARAAAAIRHENIVQVYSVEEHPLPYMVMEFVDGITLQQRQNGDGPLDLSDVLSIGRQIASGLTAAHALGLIHRDIKPANILLENGVDQKVKITDFGLARTADDASLTVSGMIAGTPMYMAPEQATGQALDHRADLFSLGSVLYQIASGRPPFRAANTVAVLRRVVEDTPRPIQEIIPEAPDWLVAIISKLHAKDPHERFQTAREVADLLERCQAELKISGVPNLPFELTSTIALDRKKLPAAIPSWWFYSSKNYFTLSGTLFLFALFCVGILGIGSGMFGMPMRSLSGYLATFTGIIAACGCGVSFYFSRQNEFALAQSIASITAATFLITTGNLLLMQLSPANVAPTKTAETITSKGSPTTETQVERPITKLEGWHGWPADAPKAAIAPFDAAQARKHQEEWAAYLKVPVEFTNSIGMKFRLIPPGEFTMGLTPEEMELQPGEVTIDGQWANISSESSPAHRVLISKPYYMGKFEVTQEQYEKIIGKNPSFFSPVGEAKEQAKDIDTREFPVDFVCVLDAADFCTKLSQKEDLAPAYSVSGNVISDLGGNGYRLPTEAEWEAACRAGTTTAWSHGKHGSDLPVIGDRTHKTGILKANPYGLFDMHGNVVEWCQDWYDAKVYSQRGNGLTINPLGPNSGTFKVGRGVYALHPDFPLSRSAARGAAPIDYRARGNGFRISLSIDGAKAALKRNNDAATTPTVKVIMNVKNWSADAPNPAVAPFDAKQATKHQEEWAEYLKVPVEYKNKLGMTFVLIPPGVFTMGITKEEAETLSILKPNDAAWKQSLLTNAPTRQVMISKPYYLAQYEVTQEEYEKVIGKNPSSFSANGGDKQKVVGEFAKRHPVEMVTFVDAATFCIKLSEQDRLKPAYQIDGDNVNITAETGYRLPTEAQWEFACRAGTTTPWFFGNQESAIGDYAWIDRNSEGRSHFVGSMKSNPFDLFDMTGNVWEWCQDWYHPQGAIGSQIDPTGPMTGEARILRGGDWASGTIGCCSAFRGYALTGIRDRNGGFRVSLSVDAVREKSK